MIEKKLIKDMGFKRTLLVALSGTALLGQAPFVLAQDEEEKAEDSAGTLEEVIVTGYRGSLLKSLNAKRFSEAITDVISAEDVGKSTDANIAEALQRVTGISIDRSNGEGTTVTVRGVSADLNNVTMNGVTLTATGGAGADLRQDEGSNAVNFSQFSSDILSQIEVVKTPSAEQDEGSLGAAINLRSFKPLNANEERRVVELQSRYNGFSKDNDYRVNVSLSEKLMDDKLGLSLVASSETQGGRSDAYRIQRYVVHRAGPEFVSNNGNTDLPGGYTNDQTGELITEFDYGDGLGPRALHAHVPFEMSYWNDTFQRDRNTFNGAIQFKPGDKTDIQLDITYSELTSESDSQRFSVRPLNNSREGFNNRFDPETFTLVGYRRTANDVTGPGRGPHINPGYNRPQSNITDITEKNRVFALDIEHEVGDFVLNLRGGHAKTTAEDDRVIQSTFQIENQPNRPTNPRVNSFNAFTPARAGFFSGYDCPNGIQSACNIVISAENVGVGRDGLGDISDSAGEYSFGSFNFRDRYIDDTSSSLFFDVDWNRDLGPITSVEAGLKWTDRTKDQRQTNTNFNRFGVASLFGAPLSDFSSGSTPADTGAELGIPRDSLSDGWPTFDPFLALSSVELQDPDNVPKVTPSLVNSRVLSNEVMGGYIQANFALMDDRLTGNVGLRYVETDVDVSGGASVSLLVNQFTNDANNVAFFGSQAAAEAVIGRDLAPRNLPNNGGPNPDFVELDAVPNSVSHSYNNTLPSLNLNYLFSDELILRFSASRTMARPPIDQLNPRFLYTENAFNAQSSANGGNPFLAPFKSTNLDLSVEWYFEEDSLLSVALFDKDLSDFTRRTSELFFIRDLRDHLYDENGIALPADQFGSAVGEAGFSPSINDLLPFDPDNQPANCMPNREFDLGSPNGQIGVGCDVVAFETFVNGDGGFVRGAEFSFQHNFTYLPGIWSGLGIIANYTFSDSETAEETVVNDDGSVSVTQLATPFPETSRHTYNLTAFYEKDGLFLRLAYNDRSDYLIDANILGGYAHYREGSSSLDLSGGWDITDNLQLNFQAVNLTDTVRRDYAVFHGIGGSSELPTEEVALGSAPTGRTQFLQNTGAIYRLGLRYSF